jgi:hypothetical protein
VQSAQRSLGCNDDLDQPSVTALVSSRAEPLLWLRWSWKGKPGHRTRTAFQLQSMLGGVPFQDSHKRRQTPK